MQRLTFDVYGRYVIHVERVEGRWRVMRVGMDGKRSLLDLEVPADLPAGELARYLDDVLHEESGPGETVRLIQW